MTNLQFSQNLLSHILFGIDADYLSEWSGVVVRSELEENSAYLSGHDHLGGGMHNLRDCPSIARAQLLQRDQILTAQVETKLQADFKRVGAVTVQIADSSGNLGITVGGVGDGFRSRVQGEALDIFPLQRTGFELVGHGGRRDGGSPRGR